MAPRPIIAVTHPRACSTAFERVFMARRETLAVMHEPFGDAFYFGPEFLGNRYRDDEAARNDWPCSGTYKEVLDRFRQAENEGKRVFIKDMAYYIFAPNGQPNKIAPSLGGGDPEPGNPTVLPLEELKRFTYSFLIRHPRHAIPSYWRCTIPPRSEATGWDHFMPEEAGYDELVRLLDGLVECGIVDRKNIVMIDADDLLDHPDSIIKQYCDKIGLDFSPDMLEWSADDKKYAQERFEKWNGWHDDAVRSSHLRARSHEQKTTTVESENEEWVEKYGAEAQKVIRATVDANIPHYEYLKQLCIKP